MSGSIISKQPVSLNKCNTFQHLSLSLSLSLSTLKCIEAFPKDYRFLKEIKYTMEILKHLELEADYERGANLNHLHLTRKLHNTLFTFSQAEFR